MSRRPPIPELARAALRSRLERHARLGWSGRCRKVAARFRGTFAYVDALPAAGEHPPGTPPEMRARIDATPVRLCRLGYLGSPDRWAFAFFKYSDQTYEPSFLPSGAFEGTPEEAFDCAAGVYLTAQAALPGRPRRRCRSRSAAPVRPRGEHPPQDRTSALRDGDHAPLSGRRPALAAHRCKSCWRARAPRRRPGLSVSSARRSRAAATRPRPPANGTYRS